MSISPKILRSIERDRNRVANQSQRATRGFMRDLRSRMITATRQGQRADEIVEQAFLSLTDLISDAMIAAHLSGKVRTLQMVSTQMRGHNLRLAGTPYDEAIRFLRRRLDLPRFAIDELKRKYTAEAVEVMRGTASAAQRKVGEALTKATADGLVGDAAIATVREAAHAAGIRVTNPYLIETTVRTQTNSAYSAGRVSVYENDPALSEILWGWEYVTVGDDRVRPTHAALDGMVLPRDDPRWAQLMPPNGWGCRCTVFEVFDSGEIIEPPETVVDRGQTLVVAADRGFEFNPGAVFRDSLRVAA